MQKVVRFVLLFSLMFSINPTLPFISTSVAHATEGCEGLDEYMADLHELSDDLAEKYSESGTWEPEEQGVEASNDDMLSASPEELNRVAQGVQFYADGLRDIEPPEWLKSWHESRIEYVQTLSNMVKEASNTGLLTAAMAYMETMDDMLSDMAIIQNDVVTQCPEFLNALHLNDSFDNFVEDEDEVGSEATGSSDADAVIPLGQSGLIDGTWEVTVLAIYETPDAIEPADTWFLDWLSQYPAGDGNQYYSIRLDIKNVGTQAGTPIADLSFTPVSVTGFEYGFEFDCGQVPGEIDFMTQLDVGERVETNMCWRIRTEHIDSLVLEVEPTSSFDDTKIVRFDIRSEY